MKLVVVMCAGARATEVVEVLETAGVEGYTEIEGTKGKGKAGAKLGTRPFPGASTIVWSIVPDEKVEGLMRDLGDLSMRCYPAEGLRAFVLGVEKSL